MSMKNMKMNRRTFLQMLGWGGAGTTLAGCDMPTTVTLEEGKEEVVSYLMPEEYVIPGVGVWYASTCTQCDAACGLHGRVREGRVLKLEGNPDAPLNAGKTCMMGQSGVQAHFNPDRITAPMMRRGNSLQTVSWEDAMTELKKRVGSVRGSRFAWVTGTVSGHQRVLIDELMSAIGSKNHFAHEVVNTNVWQQVCQDMLGDAMPRFRMDKAQAVLSFGADFIGAWQSPVHMAAEYAKMRKGERGVLIQVEPKMTLTGANADLWVPARPGTEGVLALGIANFIVDRGWNRTDVSAAVKSGLSKYSLDMASEITGIEVSKIKRIASLLSERAPSLVLAGASACGHENGYEAASAIMLLNILTGAVGKTIEAGDKFAEAGMRAVAGNTASIAKFAKGVSAGKYDLVFVSGSNPVFSAPAGLDLKAGMAKAKFKVAFSQFPDETTMEADLVLPMLSGMEDWGTHVAPYSSEATLSFQQPLMEAMYKDTRGFGDTILELLKTRNKNFGKFKDYYGFIQASVINMPATMVKGNKGSNEKFWMSALQTGVIKTQGKKAILKASASVPKVTSPGKGGEYPMHLVPSARLGMWDGRHANIPWIQEAPDQISKVVWGSWAELHPRMAAKLGVHNGDYIRVSSATGKIEAQVYVHKGIHPDAVAVPMGQGHTAYGRFAKGRGINPMDIVDATADGKTGELALHATRVKVEKTSKSEVLVKMGSSETQQGRGFVRTVSADVLRRTEREA